MKILLTGAFGNIGNNTIAEILAKGGHQVRCFDLRTPLNETTAAGWGSKIEIVWGDITKPDDVQQAVAGVDHILHLAAIIPPLSEAKPEFAEAINVGGMKHLIAAANSQPKPPPLVFCSSIATYGMRYHEAPPRTAAEEPRPNDNYGRQKMACERLLKESGLPYVILRLAAVPPVSISTFDPIAFTIHPDTRIEFVHTRDVALALANTIGNDATYGKILLIGGGKNNQYIYRDWLGGMFENTGIGALPDEAFGPDYFYTDWMDTTESQALLKFQRYSWEDYKKEIRALIGWRKFFIVLFRPLIRRYLLSKSPYYKANMAKAAQ